MGAPLGYPHPDPGLGGVPALGYPPNPGLGGGPALGTPHPGLDGGPTWGTLPPTRSSIVCTCYAAVGMLLAFMQEDFLVTYRFPPDPLAFVQPGSFSPFIQMRCPLSGLKVVGALPIPNFKVTFKFLKWILRTSISELSPTYIQKT